MIGACRGGNLTLLCAHLAAAVGEGGGGAGQVVAEREEAAAVSQFALVLAVMMPSAVVAIPLVGRLLLYDALRCGWFEVEQRPDPNCPRCRDGAEFTGYDPPAPDCRA